MPVGRVIMPTKLFRNVHEDDVIFVPMFQMVGYARVGNRLDFEPRLAISSENRISQFTLK